MKASGAAAWWGGALTLVMAVTAWAGTGQAASGNASGGAAFKDPAPVEAKGTSREDLPTPEELEAALSGVRDRAGEMPVDERVEIGKRIEVTISRVNAEATSKGQATMAARLAAEFDMTAEELIREREDLALRWGEVVVGHTLLANSKVGLTMRDLVGLRSEGIGWGPIAYGLQFRMEDFVSAIKAEGRVAMGIAKPDGKPAKIGAY